jgi:hypothetical protein
MLEWHTDEGWSVVHWACLGGHRLPTGALKVDTHGVVAAARPRDGLTAVGGRRHGGGGGVEDEDGRGWLSRGASGRCGGGASRDKGWNATRHAGHHAGGLPCAGLPCAIRRATGLPSRIDTPAPMRRPPRRPPCRLWTARKNLRSSANQNVLK